MEYECACQIGKNHQEWHGDIKLLQTGTNSYEAEITGRGTYFHAIIGRHCYGNYICIPNHEVGSELSSYRDISWNRERLSRQLRIVDATTIAYALWHLEELVQGQSLKEECAHADG